MTDEWVRVEGDPEPGDRYHQTDGPVYVGPSQGVTKGYHILQEAGSHWDLLWRGDPPGGWWRPRVPEPPRYRVRQSYSPNLWFIEEWRQNWWHHRASFLGGPDPERAATEEAARLEDGYYTLCPDCGGEPAGIPCDTCGADDGDYNMRTGEPADDVCPDCAGRGHVSIGGSRSKDYRTTCTSCAGIGHTEATP